MAIIDPTTIVNRLLNARSDLRIDPVFNGGVLSVSVSESVKKALSGWQAAKSALIGADEAPISFGEDIETFSIEIPSTSAFTLVMLSYPEDHYGTEKVVSALADTGLRSAVLGEVLTAAITSPKWFMPNKPVGRMLAFGSEFQKSSDVFQRLHGNDLPEFNDPAGLLVPYMGWLSDARFVRCARYSLWNQYDRFICVVKE